MRVVGSTAVVLASAFAVSSAVATQVAGADVRVSRDDRAGSYQRFDGGSDPVLDRCATGRRAQHGPLGLAIDPTNPDVMVAVGGDRCFQMSEPEASARNVGSHWAGVWRTEDAGATWKSLLMPGYVGDDSPSAVRSSTGGRCSGASAAGVAFAADGTALVLWGCGSPETRDLTTVRGFVSRLTNHGRHLDSTATVIAANVVGGEYTVDVPGDIAVAPSSGSVYVAATTYVALAGAPVPLVQRTRVYRSTDAGRTFAPTAFDAQPLSTFAPRVAVSPDGTLFVAWREFRAGPNAKDRVMLASSRDGGARFGPPVVVAEPSPFEVYTFTGDPDGANGAYVCGSGPFACPSGYRLPTFYTAPALAADASGVHVVWGQRLPSGQGKLLIRSGMAVTELGQPRLLDAGARGHQWEPDLTSNAGVLHAAFFDSRRDPAYEPALPPGNTRDKRSSGPAADTILATSSDGGVTWSEQRVSRVATNPAIETGDFARLPRIGTPAVAAAGGLTSVAWVDNRDVVPGADRRRTGSAAATGFFGRADCDWQPPNLDAVTYTRPTLADPCLSAGGLDANVYAATIGERLAVRVSGRLRAGRTAKLRVRVRRVRHAAGRSVSHPAARAELRLANRRMRTSRNGQAVLTYRPSKSARPRRVRLRVSYSDLRPVVRSLTIAPTKKP